MKKIYIIKCLQLKKRAVISIGKVGVWTQENGKKTAVQTTHRGIQRSVPEQPGDEEGLNWDGWVWTQGARENFRYRRLTAAHGEACEQRPGDEEVNWTVGVWTHKHSLKILGRKVPIKATSNRCASSRHLVSSPSA